jgi:ATP phosphoribosyltransferase regulatory subunit
MDKPGDKALLPAGLEDVLPPYAAREAAVVERLVACFSAHGYQRVKPPLLEFEETLLAGAGLAGAGVTLRQQTFRLMDPVSQRMMGLRADMTPQVARIAATRLRKAARPLRLCYGGQILRVKGSQLRSERQFGQVGVELIGAGQDAADAEVVLLAAEALNAIGVAHLSIDLNLPPLVGALAAGFGLDAAQSDALRQALDRKDSAAVAQAAGDHAPLFTALLRAAGPADAALGALGKLSLPKAAKSDVARLRRVVGLIRDAAPDLTLTIDPVEHRGFEYQTGISFIVFARDVRGELGRGGRYTTEMPEDDPESSTGFTLYMDTVQRALPEPEAPRILYIPAGHPPADRGRAWRAQGWVTLAGLSKEVDIESAARRLGCSHALINGRTVELKD